MNKWQYKKGLHDLGNGLYGYLQPDGGYGYSNAGLIADSGEAMLVDTLIDLPLTREMLDAISRAEPQARINRVLNTHAHPDHTAGNSLLPEAEIIASNATLAEMRFIASPENPIARILANPEQFGEPGAYLHEVMGRRFEIHQEEQRMPTRTFEDELTVRVGDKEVRLLKFGPGHTDGDTVAYVPSERVVFTGDLLFNQVHPVINMIPVASWLAACERILAIEADIVVPGHGPITDKGGVRNQMDYLNYMQAEARKRYDARMPVKEATLDISLDACRGWADEELIFITVASLYREFGAPPMPMPEVMTLAARYRKAQLAAAERSH